MKVKKYMISIFFQQKAEVTKCCNTLKKTNGDYKNITKY